MQVRNLIVLDFFMVFIVYSEASQFIGFFLLCQAEVNYLGLFSHPNLVKLIGYCCEDEHRLLVYEYMANGSLENHLFISMMMNIHALRHQFLLLSWFLYLIVITVYFSINQKMTCFWYHQIIWLHNIDRKNKECMN